MSVFMKKVSSYLPNRQLRNFYSNVNIDNYSYLPNRQF